MLGQTLNDSLFDNFLLHSITNNLCCYYLIIENQFIRYTNFRNVNNRQLINIIMFYFLILEYISSSFHGKMKEHAVHQP